MGGWRSRLQESSRLPHSGLSRRGELADGAVLTDDKKTELLSCSLRGRGWLSNWKETMVSIGRVGEEREGEKLWGMGGLHTSTWKTCLESHLSHSPVGGSLSGRLTAHSLHCLIYKIDRRKTLPYLLAGFYEDNMDFSLYKTDFMTCEGVQIQEVIINCKC